MFKYCNQKGDANTRSSVGLVASIYCEISRVTPPQNIDVN